MRHLHRIMNLAAGLLILLGATGARRTSIVDTPHNLSVSGRGAIRSTTESEICIFCHSSHNASPEGPLWNHVSTTPARFKTYARSTLGAGPEQPNGATKLCLSCHDGTIAVGAIRGLAAPVPMTNVGGGGEIPVGRKGHIGLDLSGTHPVSIKFEQKVALGRPNLRWPPYDPMNEVGLDADGYVQCTSCHDPHGSRSDRYAFWRKETFSEVCGACHVY